MSFVVCYLCFFVLQLFKTDRARCDTVLFLSVNLISTLSVLLEPYMPTLTTKINAQLNQQMRAIGALDAAEDEKHRTFTLQIQPGHILGTPAALFKRIDDEQVAAWRVKYGGKPAEKAKGEPFPLQLILGQIVEAKVRSQHLHDTKNTIFEPFFLPSLTDASKTFRVSGLYTKSQSMLCANALCLSENKCA